MSDWIPLHKLLVKIVGGGTPSKSSTSYWNGNIPWASVKDFKDNQYILEETEDTITEEGLKNSASNLIPEGTPLICARMAVGRASLTSKPMAINQDVKALFVNTKEIDSGYLVRCLHLMREKLERISVGSTVKGITLSQIKELEVFCPRDAEQKAIATVLDTVDEAIQSTQAMLDKQDKIKQGLLHDLLTRGVDEHGHLRQSPEIAPNLYQQTEIGLIPKGWEASTLGKCSEIIMGQSPPGYSYNDDEKGISLINGPVEFGKRYPRKIQWTTNPTKFCENGDILFCVRGSTTARMNISNDKYCIGRGVCAIRGKKNVSYTGYIEMILVHKNNEILSEAKGNGSTFPSINSDRLYEIPVSLPKYDEQKKIETIYYLSLTSIEVMEAHLAKLLKLKSGLMQDLLTGRKRVTPALMRDVEELAKAA